MFSPFPGLLFDPARVPDAGAATSPPYDVIDDEQQELLRAAHPHNVVRLLLPDGGAERYQRAADRFAAWRSEGVLQQDASPRFYVYELDFTARDGAPRRARGVVGALQLAELGGQVQPHEETMPKTRSDRLDLLRATQANLDPIVVLSPAAGLTAAIDSAGPLRLDFTAGGARHRLYDLADPDRVAAVAGAVSAEQVVIADGHHRYVTALHHQRERTSAGPWDAIMAFVAPAIGSGLSIASAHRFFADLPHGLAVLNGRFEQSPAEPAPPGRPGELVLVPGPAHGAPPMRLVPTDEALAGLPASFRRASAAIARDVLYPILGVTEDNAVYHPDAEVLVGRLAESPRGAAVLTAPVDEQAVADAIGEGVVFPQKTTYFVPKPRAGLVIRAFE